MRFCQPHWDKLREAIKARGLDHLVAPDGQTAVAQMADQIERGESTPTNYDPLMAAHWAIVHNAMNTLGAGLFFGDHCPLCTLTTEHAEHCTDPGCTVESFDHWIDRAADDQAAYVAEHLSTRSPESDDA